ncbi:hypothetical protein [Persicitalea jodogahamensis]|uniref:Uncharacterized protein n=1 Tax=Persicitalea jodogahamensis TaxID=402147 RepID=A0A8J3D6V8_9BACT|nr:hypothetical protein GCM10007390_10730 [Persicitalea jodogahamensis]
MAFTPAIAKIHFTIANRTDGRILSLLVLQSDDSSFATFDTLRTIGEFSRGMIMAGGPNSMFKAYQKIIIQTDYREFDTGPLSYGGRCSAFSLVMSPEDLKVSRDYSYKIMRWIRLLLVIFLFTYIIKGLPLLLIVRRRFGRIYKDFLILNGIFAICFLVSLNFSFGGSHGEGIERSSMFIYAILLLTAALETYRYSEQVSESSKRLIIAIVVSNLLWAFPGYLVTLFGVFIFSGC